VVPDTGASRRTHAALAPGTLALQWVGHRGAAAAAAVSRPSAGGAAGRVTSTALPGGLPDTVAAAALLARSECHSVAATTRSSHP